MQAEFVITERELHRIIQAGTRLEQEGTSIFEELCQLVGETTAKSLLIAHMAKKYGSWRRGASMLRQTRFYRERGRRAGSTRKASAQAPIAVGE
jgi:hypothetical protein